MRPKRDIAGRSGQPGTGTKAGEKAAAKQEKTNARKIAPKSTCVPMRGLSTKRAKREIRAIMHEFWHAAESGPGEKAEGGEGTKRIIAFDRHEGGTKREEEAERTERVESKGKKNPTEGIQKEGGHKEGKQREVPDCLAVSGQVHQKMPVMAAANPIASGKAEALLHLAIDLTWCRPGEIGGIESSVRNPEPPLRNDSAFGGGGALAGDPPCHEKERCGLPAPYQGSEVPAPDSTRGVPERSKENPLPEPAQEADPKGTDPGSAR